MLTFDRLGKDKDRILVFDRFGRSNIASSNLIPRKWVFGHLQLDIERVQQAKNKERVGHAERANHANREHHQGVKNFQNSKTTGNQGGCYCIHCLRPGHWRVQCQILVTCYHCKKPGHHASRRPSPVEWMGFQPKVTTKDCFQGKVLVNGKHIDMTKGQLSAGPFASSLPPPPVFQSFSDFSQIFQQAAPMHRDSSGAPSTYLVIFTTTSPPSPPPSGSTPQIVQSVVLEAPMAYQITDPKQFMPRGFQRLQVRGRRFMTRAVARRRLSLHKDWTILTIVSLPLHEVHFPVLREIVQEFLVRHKRV
jgi:hypothetical protein